QIEGIPLHIVDTAGIRETEDAIEVEGIRRAWAALASADIVLNVVDASAEKRDPDAEPIAEPIARGRQINVFNKIDRLDEDGRVALASGDPHSGVPGAFISAMTGEGLDALKAAVLDKVGAGSHREGGFSARQRHIDALKRVGTHLVDGRTQLVEHQAGELLAEELRLAQKALGEITGEVTADDLLGEIFASFCIGK
ncbi:MAG TPA: GTPase, partial [Burkholderiales bacterium]|nr:GTPase [Burkholderiales bacterium]